MPNISGQQLLRPAILSVFLSASMASARQIPLEVVVSSGDPAPGIPGAHFGLLPDTRGPVFGLPVLDNSGRLSFKASVAGPGVDRTDPDAGVLGNDTGLWVGKPGRLSLAARAGDALPAAGAGVSLDDFQPTGFSINGVAPPFFHARLRGFDVDDSNNEAILVARHGDVRVLLRKGDKVPDTPQGATVFGFARSFPPRTDRFGGTGFFAALRIAVTRQSRLSAIFLGAKPAVSAVLLSGDAAPGTEAGVTFVDFFPPAMNANGQVFFYGALAGDGVSFEDSAGLWAGYPDALQLVARLGRHAPGMPDDHRWVFFHQNHSRALNDAGEVAFWGATAEGPGQPFTDGIWRGTPDGLSLVAREGDHAPGMPDDVVFSFLGAPILNAAGQIAFDAFLRRANSSHIIGYGLWSGVEGRMRPVALEGQPAPGAERGVVFRFPLSLTTMNALGQIVFSGSLRGPGVTPDNDIGIWALDQTGRVRLVARAGERIDPGRGDSRTISRVRARWGSAGQDGGPIALNDEGMLAVAATFTDGTEAILLAKISGSGTIGDHLGGAPRRRLGPH